MATPTAEYDVIVVGGGVMGSYAAYHLCKEKLRVLIIDKFFLPHSRGSSSGPSRIIRNAYVVEHYARMMPDAYRMWRTLEEEANTKLIKTTGMLSVGKEESRLIEGVRTSLKKWNLPYHYLNPSQIRKRYPMIQYPDDYVGVLDPEAGLINADRCLQALWQSIRKEGGVIRDGEEVNSITPGDIVTVKSKNGTYTSKSVVLTVGPWTNDVLRSIGVSLPLKTQRGYHVYWKEKINGQYSPDNGFPVVLDDKYDDNGYTYYYAFPSFEYPSLLKIGMRKVPPPNYIHPDERDKGLDMTPFIKEVGDMIRQHFPGVEDTPSISEPCVYTMSPDGDFVIDQHPKYNNIVIGAGFSGHGFKLAPVVGKLLGELATDRKPSHDMTYFRIERFDKAPQQSKL